jgi:hypothetical protein
VRNSPTGNIIDHDCSRAGKHKHKRAEAFRDQAFHRMRAHKLIVRRSK